MLSHHHIPRSCPQDQDTHLLVPIIRIKTTTCHRKVGLGVILCILNVCNQGVAWPLLKVTSQRTRTQCIYSKYLCPGVLHMMHVVVNDPCRCLIELFCGVVCVVTLPFWHFCWCSGFCHRTESDLFLFLLTSFISLTSESLCSVKNLSVP